MSQVPDVNSQSSGGNFLTGITPVSGAATDTSLADQFYQDFFSADSVSNGSVVTGQETAQNAPVSAAQYQASVQAAIDAFVSSVASATVGDVNFVSNIVNNALGSVLVPDSNQIQAQYNADSTLTASEAALVADYNNYTQGQVNTLSSTLTTNSASIANDVDQINTISNAAQTPAQQIQTLLNQYNADYGSGNYVGAEADINSALSIYNDEVVNPYNDLTGDVGEYNSNLNAYYAANPLDPGYTAASWAAVQQAVVARNSNTSIIEFYGNLSNLPNFPAVSQLANTISLTGSAPTAASTFNFPFSVDAGTDIASVTNAFNSMISAAGTFVTNNVTLATQATSGYTANSNALSGSATPSLNTPTMPTYATYFQNVTQQIADLFTSSSFKELLATLGIQNDAASQALTAILLSLTNGSPTILLTNPSGGAVTGATLNTSSNSAFVQAFATALQAELLREVQTGETYQTPTSIKSATTQPSDANALPSGVTDNSGVQSPSSDPATASGGGILANIPLLTSDFAALLGQYSVLAAIQVLQSDTNLSSEDTATVQSEFLSAVSSVIGNISAQDLDNRITALFQSQGLTVSQNDLTAINNTVTQFQTALQGIIANSLSSQTNLANATLGAQVATQYVQSTFQEAKATTTRDQQQLAEVQLSDQQVQELLAQLPQQSYLENPAALAQAATQNGGSGPNGSLGAALAGVLPKDANGNFTSVTPTQLYNDLTSIQGQAQGSATFLQFIQNEPSYQLDEVTGSNTNRGKAGHLQQHLQANQTSTLAATANKNFSLSLIQKNNQFDAETSANQTLSSLINNPSLAEYYSKKLLPGQNLLNTGLQVRKDQFLQTPQSRNTTDFVV